MLKTLAALSFAVLIFLASVTSRAVAEEQKAILVTGTSSGFGRLTTELLTKKGHFVYAGVLNEGEMEIWKDNPNVRAVILDVTKPKQIAAAVDVVREGGRGLYGIVNNAGIAVCAPLIEVDEEDFHLQMDVNVYGVYRITKAFAPFVIESKGRIATVSSISGVVAPPAFGPYTMSKFAMEGYGVTLRREMDKFGVQCCLIEPGPHRTSIGERMIARMKADGKLNFEDSRFKEEMNGAITWATEAIGKNGGDPQNVANAIYNSLFDQNPKPRYLVAPTQDYAGDAIDEILTQLKQFNEGHEFSYSEEQLIEMLKSKFQE